MMSSLIRDIVGRALDCDASAIPGDAKMGTHPKWDSLAQLSIMLELQQHFGIAIDGDSIRRYASLQALLEFEAGRQAGAAQ
jgi:acyl carrier protein